MAGIRDRVSADVGRKSCIAMDYRKIDPAPALRPFVKCYYLLEADLGTETRVVQSPPNGYAGMVFNYGDPYHVSSATVADTLVPRCFFAGQSTTNYSLTFAGTVGIAGIVFMPAAVSTLFGISMEGTADNRIELSSLLGDEVRAWCDSIIGADSPAARIEMIQNYLTSKLTGHRARYNVADLAASRILSAEGNITVEELASELCVSRRQLERKFLEKTGLSPKLYARIVRMSPISNFVAHHDDEKIDWQDLVFKGGFHDQNHFVKDFKKLNKLSPEQYHNKHQELTRYIRRKKK